MVRPSHACRKLPACSSAAGQPARPRTPPCGGLAACGCGILWSAAARRSHGFPAPANPTQPKLLLETAAEYPFQDGIWRGRARRSSMMSVSWIAVISDRASHGQIVRIHPPNRCQYASYMRVMAGRIHGPHSVPMFRCTRMRCDDASPVQSPTLLRFGLGPWVSPHLATSSPSAHRTEERESKRPRPPPPAHSAATVAARSVPHACRPGLPPLLLLLLPTLALGIRRSLRSRQTQAVSNLAVARTHHLQGPRATDDGTRKRGRSPHDAAEPPNNHCQTGQETQYRRTHT